MISAMSRLLRPSLDWLLVFVPATVIVHLVSPESHVVVFILACLAVIPLAGWMGKATEHLATRTGAGLGGLLNATFGNAAELIIAIVALRRGMIDIVKASLTGSIIGNILLVLGASLLAGGMRFREQKFQAQGGRMQSTMLTLAVIALVAPAAFHYAGGASNLATEATLSAGISVVLLVVYACGLFFSLKTHKHLFDGIDPEVAEVEHEGDQEHWPVKKALGLLLAATVFVAWMSEILVGSVEGAAHELGMNNLFVGVIVVAIIGNAAEHSTAILMALKNRMDLSLGIAIGSSIQVALFIAPLLVLLSFVIAPQPMDLVFTPSEIMAVALSVAITSQIAGDGESNWMEGVLLLAVYLILGIVFFFMPGV